MKLRSVLILAMGLLVSAAGPALANGGFAMAVDVKNSQVTFEGEDGGDCTWEVMSDVTVVNLTDEPLTFTDVGYMVSWIAPDGTSGVVTDIFVLNDGGLRPGVTLAPDERRTFSPLVVQVTIPCKAELGDLAVRVTSPQGTGSGDAPFLAEGTPVPPRALGLAGLAALLAVPVLWNRRFRRRATA